MQESYWSEVGRHSISRRRALVLASGTAAGAAFLAACGGSSSRKTASNSSTLLATPGDTTQQAKRNGVMKDRTHADPSTLDPSNSSVALNTIVSFSYSALVQLKPGYLKPSQNEVAPDLIESWETSPDGLQVTMKLRPGVKWHNKAPVNGRLLDADDIRFSWDRFVRIGAGRMGVVNSVNPQAPVLSLTATDATTFVLKLKEPIVYALGLLAAPVSGQFHIFPKEADSAFNPRNDVIGTGPLVMSNYTPSVGMTFKRHPDYWEKDAAMVDQVDLPIVSEYAAVLAQVKAGNIYSFGNYVNTPKIMAEDVLPLKRDEPRISIYQGDIGNAFLNSTKLQFGWLPAGKSPFLDERVRQAVSMSWDRDLFIETIGNVSKFEAAGLPVETRWNSALPFIYEGYWLDPRGKDFGTNSKYFNHDVTEAKKLLAASGYANGLDTPSKYVTGNELPLVTAYAQILDGMTDEIGVRYKTTSLDYTKEYPVLRTAHGQFDGWAYLIASQPSGGEAAAVLANEYWSKGGDAFHGFSVGQSSEPGDPQLDALLQKARVERDVEKRKALVFDVQRYLGKAMYVLSLPGGASAFNVAWPCVGNFQVYQGAPAGYRLWIDETKPPFKAS